MSVDEKINTISEIVKKIVKRQKNNEHVYDLYNEIEIIKSTVSKDQTNEFKQKSKEWEDNVYQLAEDLNNLHILHYEILNMEKKTKLVLHQMHEILMILVCRNAFQNDGELLKVCKLALFSPGHIEHAIDDETFKKNPDFTIYFMLQNEIEETEIDMLNKKDKKKFVILQEKMNVLPDTDEGAEKWYKLRDEQLELLMFSKYFEGENGIWEKLCEQHDKLRERYEEIAKRHGEKIETSYTLKTEMIDKLAEKLSNY